MRGYSSKPVTGYMYQVLNMIPLDRIGTSQKTLTTSIIYTYTIMKINNQRSDQDMKKRCSYMKQLTQARLSTMLLFTGVMKTKREISFSMFPSLFTSTSNHNWLLQPQDSAAEYIIRKYE